MMPDPQSSPSSQPAPTVSVYPLLLRPEFHARVWGGRRLAEVLGAELPEGAIGESWSMGTDNKVLNGPLAGQALGKLCEAHPDIMLGSAVLAGGRTDLPLLFKILDAQDLLSIQVHPEDDYAREVEHVPFGKTEAWYTLDATPGAYVIHGFTRPVTPEEVRAGLVDGSVVEVLRKVELHPGDSLLVPAGTVHAIGGGLLLGEIQENSDITYRLYDWGRPREMHIEKGLEVMTPRPAGFSTSPPLPVQSGESVISYLVACRYFLYRELSVQNRLDLDTGGRSFHCLFCFSGEGAVGYGSNGGRKTLAFKQGQTVFIPAALGSYSLVGGGVRLLDACVPDLHLDVVEPLLAAGYSPEQIGALGGAPGNEVAQAAAR